MDIYIMDVRSIHVQHLSLEHDKYFLHVVKGKRLQSQSPDFLQAKSRYHPMAE